METQLPCHICSITGHYSDQCTESDRNERTLINPSPKEILCEGSKTRMRPFTWKKNIRSIKPVDRVCTQSQEEM